MSIFRKKDKELEAVIDQMVKADDDGDKRYINQQWYKDRVRGIR